MTGAPRRQRRALESVAAVCLACGAGGAFAGPVAAAAAATTTPASPPRVSPSALARRALLVRADLGRGWSVEAPAPRRAPRLTCRAYSPVLSGVRVRASVASPTFSASVEGPFLAQSVYRYGAPAQEANVWRHVVTRRLLRCAVAAFAAGGRSYAVAAGHVAPLHDSAGTVTRLRVVGTVAGGGQTLPAYLDELVLGRGAAITTLDVSSLEVPPSDRLESRLAALAARKLPRSG